MYASVSSPFFLEQQHYPLVSEQAWRQRGDRQKQCAATAMHLAVAADSKAGGGGEDGGGNWYNFLNFFSHCCGLCFCLAYVELYDKNSTTGNIAIFPLSQGIYPAGSRIYPKRREIPIELETVVTWRNRRLPSPTRINLEEL